MLELPKTRASLILLFLAAPGCGDETTAIDDDPGVLVDSTRIAYVRNERVEIERSSVRTIRADGLDDREVAAVHEPAWLASPSWSPDGARVAFAFLSDYTIVSNYADVIVHDTVGPGFIAHDHRWADLDPAIDPTGQWIAFTGITSNFNPEPYLLVAPVDGGEADSIAEGDGATWSPDGQSIAFVRAARLYIVPRTGGEPARVKAFDFGVIEPAWSPDGQRFLLTGFPPDDASGEVYVMNADGSGLQRLTQHPGRDRSPTWSPDGTRFAFERDFDIVTRSLADTTVTYLTDDPAQKDIEPSWHRP